MTGAAPLVVFPHTHASSSFFGGERQCTLCGSHEIVAINRQGKFGAKSTLIRILFGIYIGFHVIYVRVDVSTISLTVGKQPKIVEQPPP